MGDKPKRQRMSQEEALEQAEQALKERRAALQARRDREKVKVAVDALGWHLRSVQLNEKAETAISTVRQGRTKEDLLLFLEQHLPAEEMELFKRWLGE